MTQRTVNQFLQVFLNAPQFGVVGIPALHNHRRHLGRCSVGILDSYSHGLGQHFGRIGEFLQDVGDRTLDTTSGSGNGGRGERLDGTLTPSAIFLRMAEVDH